MKTPDANQLLNQVPLSADDLALKALALQAIAEAILYEGVKAAFARLKMLTECFADRDAWPRILRECRKAIKEARQQEEQEERERKLQNLQKIFGGHASTRLATPVDKQVARAIMAVSGDGGPLRAQKHYVGVISVMMWLGWPQKYASCCTLINQLPGHEKFTVVCSESGLWRYTALGFARVPYDKWDTYKPRKGEEEQAFRECKAVADAFCMELQKN